MTMLNYLSNIPLGLQKGEKTTRFLMRARLQLILALRKARFFVLYNQWC
jgi:hypothetical protein